MNLNDNPTVDQVRELLRKCDDYAGPHLLWVSKSGELHITLLPKRSKPEGFVAEHPEIQLRMEMFEAGNEYVGPEAAYEKDHWVEGLLTGLAAEWRAAAGKSEATYLDLDSFYERYCAVAKEGV